MLFIIVGNANVVSAVWPISWVFLVKELCNTFHNFFIFYTKPAGRGEIMGLILRIL